MSSSDPSLVAIIREANGLLPVSVISGNTPSAVALMVWYTTSFSVASYIVGWISTGGLTDQYAQLILLIVVIVFFLLGIRQWIAGRKITADDARWHTVVLFLFDSLLSLAGSIVINLIIKVLGAAIDLRPETIVSVLLVMVLTMLVVVFAFVYPALRTMFMRIDSTKNTTAGTRKE